MKKLCCGLSLLDDKRRELGVSLGLLLLRLGVGGGMAFGHGWGKLMSWPTLSAKFPDPLGVGPSASLSLAIFAELFCSLAIMLGFATRLSVIPLIVTMLVAAFVIHGADPWQKKELAVLYLFPFLTLVFTGPGRFSLDALVVSRLGPDREP